MFFDFSSMTIPEEYALFLTTINKTAVNKICV